MKELRYSERPDRSKTIFILIATVNPRLLNFSCALPKSRVGYNAGEPIESVTYCLNIIYNPHLFASDLSCFWVYLMHQRVLTGDQG